MNRTGDKAIIRRPHSALFQQELTKLAKQIKNTKMSDSAPLAEFMLRTIFLCGSDQAIDQLTDQVN